MSVLIKGMEMPEGCWYCDFCFQDMDSERNGWIRCAALEQREIIPSKTERQPDCPLIEVQPHGRLIDADAMIEMYEKLIECNKDSIIHMTYHDVINEAIYDLKQVPTVISADKDGGT